MKTTIPVRYEFTPATGLTVQSRDSDIVYCDVAGYGPGTTAVDAREYVDRVGGTLVEFDHPAK